MAWHVHKLCGSTHRNDSLLRLPRMKIDFLFSRTFGYVFELLKDLIRFVLQPRSYFATVLDEDILKTVRRFVLYLFFFNNL